MRPTVSTPARVSHAAKSDAKALARAAVNPIDATEEDRRYVFPASLGACVDRLRALDAKADLIKRQLKEVEDEYGALEKHLIDSIPKEDLQGATGKTARVELDRKTVPTAKDWDAIYAYIKKTGAWELLHKRLSTTACNERWAAKRVIPGVEPFTVVKLKLSPLKKRGA
jgi:hypothetical protein